jgi:hypothetical protein
MLACECAEGKLIGGPVARSGGELKPAPGWERAHDCGYIKARNKLIPEAERMADAAVAAMPGTEPMFVRRRWSFWGAEFTKAMDDLWRARTS